MCYFINFDDDEELNHDSVAAWSLRWYAKEDPIRYSHVMKHLAKASEERQAEMSVEFEKILCLQEQRFCSDSLFYEMEICPSRNYFDSSPQGSLVLGTFFLFFP